MAKSNVTSNVGVDVILQPGTIVGEKELEKILIRQLNSIDLPTTKIAPNFAFDKNKSGFQNLTREMTAIQNEVNKALDGTTKSGYITKIPRRQLEQVQATFQQMDKLVKTRQGLKRFDSQEFQEAFKAFYAGEIKDPQTGKMREVNEATISSLKDLKTEAGKPIFPKNIVDQVRQYKAEYKHLQKELLRTEDLLRNIRSMNVFSPINKSAKPRLGGVPSAKEQKQSSLALGEIDAMQQTISGVQSHLMTPAQIRKREEDREKRSRREYKERLQAEKENEARYKQSVADLALAKKRKSAAQDIIRGRSALSKWNKRGVLEAHEYSNAIKALTAQQQANAKALVRADNAPARDASHIETLNKKAAELNSQLKLAKKNLNDLSKPTPASSAKRAGYVPPGGAKQFQIIGGTPTVTNAQAAGKQAFLSSGGFGGTYSVPDEHLRDVAAYHKARIDSLTKAQAQLSRSSTNFQKDYARMGKAIYNHGRDLEHAKERMQSFGSATQQTTSLFRQFFRYAIGYGALYQALAAIRALIAGVVDLEKALKGIQAVTQATNAEMRLIESGIKSIALETQFNTREIADAAQILGQAGVIPQELPAALRATALFASATGSAIELSADLVTSMRNVFTTLSDQSIANQLTQAINISKLTAADLKTVISLSSQIAKSYNLSADKYLAAVTTLRNAGIKPSTVATGLRQGLLEIFSPDSKTIKALSRRYRELGEELSTDAIRDKFFSFSLTDSPLVAALQELQRLGFTGAGKKTFQRAYDIRAENAISALINNMGELEAASARLTFGEAAAVAAQTQMESLAHSVSNLGAAISVFSHDLGQPLLGLFEGWADGATNFIQRLTELNTELQITKGYGLEVAGLVGTLSGVLGYKLAKGGIPGKVLAGAGFAAAGANLSSSLSKGQEQTAEEEAKTAIGRIWETLGDVGQSALLTAGPVLLIELFNKFRGKGSPLLGSVTRIFRKKQKGIGKTDGLDIISGKSGAASKIPDGAAEAAEAIGVLGYIFGNKVWKKLQVVAGPVLQFLRRNPVVLGITAFYGLIAGITSFFDAKSADNQTTKYKALLKRRDRAAEKYRTILESQDEFRLGSVETDATPGTTAASIDKIQEDLKDYSDQLDQYFGKEQSNIEEITKQLLDLNKIAPEEGSAARIERLEALKNSLDSNKVSQDITPAILNRLANQASSVVSRGNALRESIATYVTNLSEKSGLEGSSLAFKEAYDKIVQNDSQVEALIYGYETGGSPEEAAQAVIDTAKLILEEQRKIFRALPEVEAARQAEIQARSDVIRGLIQEIKSAPDDNALLTTLRDFGAAFAGLSDGAVETLELYIEEIETQLATIQGRLKAPEFLQERKQELQAGRDDLTFGVGPIQTYRAKNQPTISAIDTEIRAIDEEMARLKKAAVGLTEEARNATIALGRFKLLREEKVAARTTASEVEAQRIRTEIDTSQVYAPGAETDERRALERSFPEGGERLAAIDKLLSTGDLSVLLEIGDKGELANLTDTDRQALADIQLVRKQLLKQSADFANEFHQNLPLYKQLIEAERAIKDAKKKKDFSLLTTASESENLYKQLEALKIRNYKSELDFLKDHPGVIDEEKLKINKRKYDLEKKIEDAKAEALEGIASAEVDAATAALAEFKKSTARRLEGYKKQRAKAIDSGQLRLADELDAKIVAIKEEILFYEVKRLEALKTKPEDIERFKRDSREDQLLAADTPTAARTYANRSKQRVDRIAPKEPRLSDDPYKEGYLRQQGKEASLDERTEARDLRIDTILADMATVEAKVDRMTVAGPPREADAEAIRGYQETIRLMKEEIGRLRGENQDESGFVPGALTQLRKGFDLKNVSATIDQSESSISNLGKTIQNDLVGGLDDAADGFANALANGESFTDGLKQSFSDMFRQIAADMIKSGILSLFSQGAVGLGTFFGTGASTGGVVGEGYAEGGKISGPGTGTSDSIPGAVVDGSGRVTRGIRVSDGEGILTAKATGGIGEGTLNFLNKASASTLQTVRRLFMSEGYRRGGIPSPVGNPGLVAAGALRAMSMPPLRFAAGGMVKDAYSTSEKMSAGGKANVTTHNFNASVNIEASEDSGMTADDLRRLDDGLNLKVQEYIEEQMRPGGALQSVRGGR